MARSRCTCTFHGNDMEMTVIPGNFQDKIWTNCPANLCVPSLFSCNATYVEPGLQQNQNMSTPTKINQANKKAVSIDSYHISSRAQIWVSPYKTTRVLSGTLESGSRVAVVHEVSHSFSHLSLDIFLPTVGSHEMLKQDISPPFTTTPSYQLVLKGPAHCCKA